MSHHRPVEFTDNEMHSDNLVAGRVSATGLLYFAATQRRKELANSESTPVAVSVLRHDRHGVRAA